MADGEITFSTKLDNSELQKQLKDTEKEIERATAAKAKATEAKLPLEKQLESLKPKMEEARKDLEEYRQRVQDARDAIEYSTTPEDKKAAKEALKEDLRYLGAQEKEVAKLEKQWTDAEWKVEQYNAQIADADAKIASAEDKAGGIMQQLEKRNGTVAKAVEKAGVSMKGIEKTLISLARRVFVFQLITKALRSAREYFGKLLSTNQEYNIQVQRLRAALATAFQPLYEAALPVLMKILNLLTQIATVAAQVISNIFGKTVSQSAKAAKALNAQAKAIGGVGSAAEEAAGQLASFDEINQLEDPSSNSGGAGGSDMDFSEIEGAGELSERLQEILNYVGMIGAGLALWKLSDKLPGGLSLVAKKMAGILLTIGSILLFTHGFKDAAKNGIDLFNTLEMIGGAIGAGLGISLLVNSWIPLLIGGLVAAVIGIAYFTGHGQELIDGLWQICEGFNKFIHGEFAEGFADIKIGWEKTIDAQIASIKELFNKFFDWIDTKSGGKYSGFIDNMRTAIGKFLDMLGDFVKGDKKQMALDAVGCLVAIGDALLSLFGLDITVSDIFAPVKNVVNNFFTWWENTIVPKIEALINKVHELKYNLGFNSRFNYSYGTHSGSTGKIDAGIGDLAKDWLRGLKIPFLAEGAVIPPNARFLAALGDQSHGYNLEGPEDMFRGIVREEIRAAGGGQMDSGKLDEMIDLLGALIGAVNGIGDDRIGRAASRYISRTNRARGT